MNARSCAWLLLAALAGCQDSPSVEPLVTVGGRHACVLESTGTLRCFGAVDWPIPVDWAGGGSGHYVVPPVDVGEQVVHAAAGSQHLCAVAASGDIHCWGDGPGLGDDHRRPAAAVITAVEAPFVRVAAGGGRTCGVTEDGRVWCWGTGFQGQLGYDTQTEVGDDESPADIGPVPLPWRVTDVVVTPVRTCALLEDGRVGCWGGSMGTGRESQAVDVGGEVVQLSAGRHGVCARLADGGVRCWDGGVVQAYGDDAEVCWPGCVEEGSVCCEDGKLAPAERGDLPLGAPAIDVSVGEHTCVTLAGGEARCWGSNSVGQLGLGHHDAVSGPTAVDVGGPAVSVSAGAGRTCARLQDETVRCWGLTERWDGTTDWDCYVEVPNPNAGAICEPATIDEFSCEAGQTCCLGDDEPASAARPVPL